MDSNEKIIFQTLLYYDIFDYPLTKEEIWQFAVDDLKLNKSNFHEMLQRIKFPSFKTFYYLRGRKKIVNQRIKKENINKSKLKKAIKIIKIIKFIPTVKFIGISGSLSMQNSNLEDDIDIFVICKNNLVWFTRCLLVITLSLVGVYRNKYTKNYKDKICLNLIIGENNMGFFSKKKNLYFAHEIVQLLPIYQKDNIYLDFIKKNKWVDLFLPNYLERITKYKIALNSKERTYESILIKILLFSRIELIAKFLQWNYMKKNITEEIISSNVLAFHPLNYEQKTIIILNNKFKKYFKNGL